jgi:DNA invertase Pin-like site-specific DNA recombinase
MIYGYARVSTVGQQKNGNSLEDQSEKLKKAGCEEILCEAYTGTKMDRPQFTELLKKLKTGDELVVCKMDRFARTVAEGSEIVKNLMDNGIVVNILNMGRIDNTPAGRLIANVFLSFAEFERDMIVERTQEGKAIARQKEGYREGRPKLAVDKEKALELVANGMSVKEACKELGISRSSWYKHVA